MESIIDYLIRHLRAAGPRAWPLIAAEINADRAEDDRVSENFMRKLAYGDRTNPGVKIVQPLLDYFHAVERGDRSLPVQQEAA